MTSCATTRSSPTSTRSYDIGFGLDEDDDLRRFETDDAEWLAVTIVRVLREVTGVVHPSFVSLWGPEPGAQPTQDPLALVFPEDRDELVEVVDATLAEVIGQAPSKDEDGDVPIVCGESVVFVRVRHDIAVVEVFSEVVVDVANTQAALFELNILNRDSPGPTFALRGDRVVVRSRIAGNPILPAELRRVVDAMCAMVDQTARDLVARIGGHTFLGEPPAKPDGRKSPGREAIRTLRHLEDDEPGSVSPVLAAHIFHLDQKAILDQIARQRRAGRRRPGRTPASGAARGRGSRCRSGESRVMLPPIDDEHVRYDAERGSCRRCGSGDVSHLVIGLPSWTAGSRCS